MKKRRCYIYTRVSTSCLLYTSSEAFKKVYKILKIGGTFMICNESNGENPKDEKWTKIIPGTTAFGRNKSG